MVENGPNEGVAAEAAGLSPTVEPASRLAGSATSIPNAWEFLEEGEYIFLDSTLVYALGRLGDVYGPLPAEMFHPDVWKGDGMLCARHDVVAIARCKLPWRDVFPLDASAIEARRAETGTGSVHESAVRDSADATPEAPTPETPDV